MIQINSIDTHKATSEAVAFANQIPLYGYANPENPNGDTMAIHVVKRLIQFAYDEGKKNQD